MKRKILTLFFFCFFTSVYSAIEVMPISPYINRGVSLTYQLSHNPITIIHYYESATKDNIYSAYQNRVYLTEGIDSGMKNTYIAIGSRKEKWEIMLGFWLFNLYSESVGLKVNHIDIGENKIFKNVAISYFGGIIHKGTSYKQYNPVDDKDIIMIYIGTTFGTRKKMDKFSYIEFFTTPQITLSRYAGLGGTYDPQNMIELGYGTYYIKGYENFDLWIHELTLPISFGAKYRNVFIKTGIEVSGAIGGETKKLNRNGVLVDNVIVDASNFSFFVNAGIHFRRFSRLEKE